MNLSLNVLCLTGEMRLMPNRASPCFASFSRYRACTPSLIAINFGHHCFPFQLKF